MWMVDRPERYQNGRYCGKFNTCHLIEDQGVIHLISQDDHKITVPATAINIDELSKSSHWNEPN